MLLLHERLTPAGALERLYLRRDDDRLELVVDGHPIGAVPREALVAVMERYGRPLADDVVVDGAAYDLGDACSLQTFRHRAVFDVLPKDFVLLRRPGREPLAELATAVTAALSRLAQAYAAR
jgi:hypothetical protein